VALNYFVLFGLMKYLKISLIVVLLTFANVFAGGFQVNLQGIKQTGMANCGAATLVDNSLLFYNPGGLVLLDSLNSITAGFSPLFPRTLYQEPQSDYSSRTLKNTGTPFNFYTNFRLKKIPRFCLGFGVYTPFGSRVQWPSNWKGKFLLQEINLRTVFFQPTLSYKINDKIGLGIGFVYASGSFLLQRALPLQNQQSQYGQGTLSGDANGMGFNAGLFFKPSEKLSFGINYRSKVVANVSSGTAQFEVPNAVSGLFSSGSFTTQLSLPSVFTIGSSYLFSEKMLVCLEINYVGWSAYDSLVIDFENNTERLSDIRSPRMYKNSFIARIGAQYKINTKADVRAGVYYDQSPVMRGYLTPETPDSDKIGITFGCSYKLIKNLSTDFAILYIQGKRREDTNIETQFSGIYKSVAVAPVIGLSWIF
jgi:long-chain fatty acid transport protein